MERSYYAVIPATVRYCADLTANAKLLYGEITALCSDKGYCWASNDYFAELYGVSGRTIQRWIESLEEHGFIARSESVDGNRRISIKDPFVSPKKGDDKNVAGGDKNVVGGRQKCHGGVTKMSGGHDKNVTHNNTYNTTLNNTKNKKKVSKKESGESFDTILSGVADDGLRELYVEYIKMRKLIKAPMTNRALEMLISKVDKLEPSSVENKKKLLENAILNNWKSVYALKPEDREKPRQSAPKQAVKEPQAQKKLPSLEQVAEFEGRIRVEYPGMEERQYKSMVESFERGEWDE